MVAIIRTHWEGTSGGPGLTQIAMNTALITTGWETQNTEPAVNAMRTFWDSLKTLLPNELTLTVSPIVDLYDPVTGELNGSVTSPTVPLPVIGQNTAVYSGGSGFKINWTTGEIKNGRRVAGHTYVVPAVSTAFTTNGTVAPATITMVNNAASAFLGTLAATEIEVRVWSRPRELPTPRPGTTTWVQSGVCSSKSAILRGRRD